MSMRAFFLAFAFLAVVAPTASAGPIDRFIPVYDASDGVTAARAGNKVVLRFGPKAAKLYRDVAGAKAIVGCGHPRPDNGETISGDGLTSRAGMTWTEVRLPRKRGSVSVRSHGAADVCFVATFRANTCVQAVVGDEHGRCLNIVVAVTEQGRTDLDEAERTFELDSLFDVPLASAQKDPGGGVVALDSPDASPPPGTVGLFKNEQTSAAVALLRDGRRWFVRQDGDVFSTNVPALSGSRHHSSLF